MTSVIWVVGVLGPAAALAPEIIKGVKAVVSSLRGVLVGRHPGTVTPWPGSAPSGARRLKFAARLLAAGRIVPPQVGGLADDGEGPEEVRAA
jgi:hypothetical protein